MRSWAREIASQRIGGDDDDMEGQAKETIILVHGTWAAPQPGKTQWYQPAEGSASAGFAAKLDAALCDRGSPARCWAHGNDQSSIFYWSGENSWIARASAASALVEHLAKLRGEGWICHIIAHSHGGNVVLDALGQLTSAPDLAWPPSCKIVTLGTPFMDVLLSREAQVDAFSTAEETRIIFRIFWIIFLVIISLIMFQNATSLPSTINPSFSHFLPPPSALSIIFVTAMLILLSQFFPFLDSIRSYFSAYFKVSPNSTSIQLRDGTNMEDVFLVMNSHLDEAWQVLFHLRSSKNPLAIKVNLITYLLTSLRSNVFLRDKAASLLYRSFAKQLSLIGKIVLILMSMVYFGPLSALAYVVVRQLSRHNYTLDNIFFIFSCLLPPLIVLGLVRGPLSLIFGEEFYVAFLSPFRWFIHRIQSVAGTLSDLATYVVRYRAWSVLQRIAMGLDGYQSKIPVIEYDPSRIVGASVHLVYMPLRAEQRALANRNDWITQHFGDISQTFANLAVNAADLSSLLRKIEEDATLVHGAYYSDEDCIAEIADWIAGRQAVEPAPNS
jgi:hypothetical protein